MIWYWPEPSVTVVRIFSMSTGLAASTVTPGSTAPDVSFTTPVMDAWANAAVGRTASRKSAAATRISTRLIRTSWLRDPRPCSDEAHVALGSQTDQRLTDTSDNFDSDIY